MRTPITVTAALGLVLFATVASADPADRGYQAQSNAIKGKFLAGAGLFGQSIDDARGHKIMGEVVYLGRGCKKDTYAADPAGKVAMVDRGTCPFTEKVAKAEAAGAIAVIVVNNVNDTVSAMVAAAGFNDTIGIPSAFVGRTHGRAMVDGQQPVTVQVKDKTRDKLDTREE
jgi:hypothetical protein